MKRFFLSFAFDLIMNLGIVRNAEKQNVEKNTERKLRNVEWQNVKINVEILTFRTFLYSKKTLNFETSKHC